MGSDREEAEEKPEEKPEERRVELVGTVAEPSESEASSQVELGSCGFESELDVMSLADRSLGVRAADDRAREGGMAAGGSERARETRTADEDRDWRGVNKVGRIKQPISLQRH